MAALRRLFANGQSTPALAGKLETAVNDVLREAEELCWLLRAHREKREHRNSAETDTRKDMSDA